MNDKSRNERGAAAIIAAITLLALLGFTALAIDAGVGYNDRRGTQSAVAECERIPFLGGYAVFAGGPPGPVPPGGVAV